MLPTTQLLLLLSSKEKNAKLGRVAPNFHILIPLMSTEKIISQAKIDEIHI